MHPLGFEPTIFAGKRPQTYALDRAAISYIISYYIMYHIIMGKQAVVSVVETAFLFRIT
jgi:hypothetical protein